MHSLTYSTGNSLMGNAENKWCNVILRKSKALPCGRIRFYSVWSELKEFWAPSLRLRQFGFQQELLKKCRVLKMANVFWSALNSGQYSSATHLVGWYLSWPKKSEFNSTENRWFEHVTTMHLSQLYIQILPLFLLKDLQKFKIWI